MNRGRFTVILHGGVRVGGGRDSRSMPFADDHDTESSVFEHSRKASFAGRNGHGRGLVIPVDGNDRPGPVLIVVVVPFIFVEREVTVGASVDAQINRVRLARGRLYKRSEGNNRAAPGIDRNSFQRGFRGDALPAVRMLAVQKSTQSLPARKINPPLRRSFRSHRIDQQSRTEHKLVGNRTRSRIR